LAGGGVDVYALLAHLEEDEVVAGPAVLLGHRRERPLVRRPPQLVPGLHAQKINK
jgi:hypothetical protein